MHEQCRLLATNTTLRICNSIYADHVKLALAPIAVAEYSNSASCIYAPPQPSRFWFPDRLAERKAQYGKMRRLTPGDSECKWSDVILN